MGMDYSVGLMAGFRVEAEAFERPFKRTVAGSSHEEPRFDRRTGEPADPELVVDEEERVVYALDGVDYEYPQDLADALAERLGATVDYCFDLDGPVWYVIGPPLGQRADGSVDDGPLSVSGGFLLSDLTSGEFLARVAVLDGQLAELGIERGPAAVLPVWSIG